MATSVRLKRHYSVVAHSADVVELRHGSWNPISFTITDDSGSGVLLSVVRLLDGNHAVSEIAREVGVARTEVQGVIDQLAELQLIEEQSTHALDYYLDHLVPSLSQYRGTTRGSTTPVVIIGEGSAPQAVAAVLSRSLPDLVVTLLGSSDALVRALRHDVAAGAFDGLAFEKVAEQFAGWRDCFVVYATDTVRPPEAIGLNRLSLHHGFPWLHAAADGPFVLVGPTFVAGRTPCYECLEKRILMNLREEASYQRYKQAMADGRVSGGLAPLDETVAAMLAAHAAFAALNFLLTGAEFTIAKVLAIYLPTMEFTFNEVLRLPGCPACGSSPESDDRELYFEVRSLLDSDA